jgi:hypothetical protein
MDRDYSKNALLQFIETLADRGLANTNTAEGMRVASAKILADVPASSDVREIDLDAEIHRFHNKNPGKLTHASVTEYGRRVKTAAKYFLSYVESPSAFKPIGRGVSKRNGKDRPEPRELKSTQKSMQDARPLSQNTPGDDLRATAQELTHQFPLRPNLVARLVLPTDLKRDEARRLAAFIATLAADFDPGS